MVTEWCCLCQWWYHWDKSWPLPPQFQLPVRSWRLVGDVRGGILRALNPACLGWWLPLGCCHLRPWLCVRQRIVRGPLSPGCPHWSFPSTAHQTVPNQPWKIPNGRGHSLVVSLLLAVGSKLVWDNGHCLGYQPGPPTHPFPLCCYLRGSINGFVQDGAIGSSQSFVGVQTFDNKESGKPFLLCCCGFRASREIRIVCPWIRPNQ